MVYVERCQRQNDIGETPWLRRTRSRLAHGLGLRSGIRRALAAWSGRPQPRIGECARYLVGAWVRVLDADRIRRTLDSGSRLRGLKFVEQQWAACGCVYRVQGAVRRILDDSGRMRPVSGTVTLAGVTCGGADGSAGCGRDCPLFFREEWLEAADVPASADAVERQAVGYADVRSREELETTLDLRGKRVGLLLMPEMFQYAGGRFPVLKKVTTAYEADRHVAVTRPVYILDGLYCTGAAMGARGPCDRACRLLWHGDWLRWPSR